MRTLRIALAQINVTVGDLERNVKKITATIEEARSAEADLVVFPELAITGYPPEDLLLKPQFIEDNLQAMRKGVKASRGLTAVFGFVDKDGDIYNAAAVAHDGELAGVYHKQYLPNYGVFDERRYFQRGSEFPVFVLNGVPVAVNICEDIWYPEGPAYLQCLSGGAEIVVNINASPYHIGKERLRETMLAARAADNAAIIAYVNLVGSQDELVFDGASLIFSERGELIARGRQFEEQLILADLNVDSVFRARLHDPRRRNEKLTAEPAQVSSVVLSRKLEEGKKRKPVQASISPRLEPLPEVYKALVLGVADYVRKNGFSKVIVGLSGGIDSALTATIAVDALGRSNVVGIFMPSRFTAKASQEDVETLAKNLGIKKITLPIEELRTAYRSTLAEPFKGLSPDITEENIQSRIRGNLLMALSNKQGWLVLTTGNKSEMSVGYTTLYGDMAGGFAVIKDIPKTLVYGLVQERNRTGSAPVIPRRVFERPPTAELKENQTDQDTLPPYPILDPILQAYVEEDRPFEEIVAMGFDEKVVVKVMAMVDASEFKRRQAPVGIKITPRALGRDRRMPITNRYTAF